MTPGRQRARWDALAVCAALAALTPSACGERPQATSRAVPDRGLWVESLENGFSARQAGLEPGDLLVRWQRPATATAPAASGELVNAFDAHLIEHYEAPLGDVLLSGVRDGEPFTLSVPSGQWRLTTRPRLEGDRQASYERALEQLAEPDPGPGVELLDGLAQASLEAGDAVEAAWFLERAATGLEAAGERQRALTELDRALDLLESGPQRELAWLLGRAARAQGEANELGVSRELDTRALAIETELDAAGAARAAALFRVAVLDLITGDIDAARERLGAAREIFEARAPESAGLAAVLDLFGYLALRDGDPLTRRRYQTEALELRLRLNPENLDAAASLHNIGIAEEESGEYAKAEEHLRQALAIKERLVPRERTLGFTLGGLGNVLRGRGDLEGARVYHERALRLLEEIAPDSLGVAVALDNLGEIALEAGALDEARERYQASLEICSRLTPGGRLVAETLKGLAKVAKAQGDLALAGSELERALAIDEAAAPRGIRTALVLYELGEVARAHGDLATAANRLGRSLEIQRSLIPESSAVAETLASLARVALTEERTDDARHLLSQAVDALEGQAGKLGGSPQARAGFRARHAEIYRLYIEQLLANGEAEEAFRVMERSRARALLAMLADRTLGFGLDLPPELEERRRTNALLYDRRQAQLAELAPGSDPAKAEEVKSSLARLRRERQEIADEIRRLVPRLADLERPATVDVAAAVEAIDDGTLVLAFSVGAESSDLFVLGRDSGLEVVRIEMGEAELRREVDAMALLSRNPRPTPLELEALRRRAGELYDRLLGPVDARLEAAERLLVLPDGPLHLLAFGALVRGDDEAVETGERAGEFLIEAKPVHLALSLTVYRELLEERRLDDLDGGRVVAFGDPVAPPRPAGAVTEAAAGVDRLRAEFERLPASRREVETLSRLYADRAEVFLGERATETRAMEAGGDAWMLHFATHGYLDSLTPLDSGIVLSVPRSGPRPGENGILQAWEVFERLRLKADLVTLSACESAAGSELRGEGLIGLTRAFHYAGARTVLASLWKVSDRSTAPLMAAFYRELKSGTAKDEALRRAQLRLIRGELSTEELSDPPASLFARLSRLFSRSRRGEADAEAILTPHPFHWAGFQLYGDWR